MSTKTDDICRLLLVLVLAIVGPRLKAQTSPAHTSRRAMVPTDLLTIRTFGAKALSPDGRFIALEVRGWARASSSDSGHVIDANHRCELWVVALNGQRKQRITPVEPVRLSQWNPVWSPDSRHLAFLSNEARGNAFLEVWDRGSGRIRRLTKVGIDLEAQISRSEGRGMSGSNIAWLDGHRVFTVLLHNESRSPSFDEYSRAARVANTGVKLAQEGLEPTAVVASYPPDGKNTREILRSTLAIIDTNSGATTVVAEIPAWMTGSGRHIVLSPNSERAAIVVAVPPTHLEAAIPFAFQMQSSKLGVASLLNDQEIHWIKGIEPSLGASQSDAIVRWDHDNARFVILGEKVGNEQPFYVAEVDASSGKWRRIHSFEWRRFDLLDDHIVDVEGRPIEPTELGWLSDGGLAVRIHHPGRKPLESPDSWWLMSGGELTPLSSHEEARLNEGRRSDGIGPVNLQTSDTGRLYETDAAGRETTIFDLNPQLEEIDPPRFISFGYETGDGQTLYANVILPFGYQQGKTYPTIIWVYGGEVHSANEKPAWRGDSFFLNLMLLTGRGYAVLIPSMPLPRPGAGDPMLHLNDGVDPAVKRAVELGVADSNRLALLGHSYGGYSVSGLLTRTQDYRAGIALMGLYDLASLYGDFPTGLRYSDPDLAADAPWYLESGQGRIGVPLWVSPERYVRNSPVFAADKIATPLLIISGDVDFLGSQSEEMFTALNRQGKRVEFVRYLGEDHTLKSPANILDMWQRIFSWLDQYLAPTSPSNRPSP